MKTLVPVSNPAHPSHVDWLAIIRKALEAAITIGPAVVTIVDPKDAQLAQQLGNVAAAAEDVITQSRQ
jgi:hypothetical protein